MLFFLPNKGVSRVLFAYISRAKYLYKHQTRTTKRSLKVLAKWEKSMGPSSDSAGSNDCESTSSNSVVDEGGCTWDELVLRNSMTALVVDGETESRLAVTEMLESAGVETEMVGSGREALNLAGTNYDLILVDRFVHDIGGLETIRGMRRRGVHSKIFGLTSRDIETDKAEIMNAGADGCLKKPVSEDALADILAEIDYDIDHR